MTSLPAMISPLLACPTCLPDKGSQVSLAQGNAILFMLILILSILGVLVYTFISFALKQKRCLESNKS
jgi:hypothetical protein